MRTAITLCALLSLLFAMGLVVPNRIGQELAPWHSEFRKHYQEAVYAKVGIHVYKIGRGSRSISSLFAYLSQGGHVDERFYFVRCGFQEPLLLSIRDPKDLARLYEIRFSKEGDSNYQRFDEFYKEQCWAKVYFQFKSIAEQLRSL